MWGVWNGFLLGKAKKEDVPCRFCGKSDGDGQFVLGMSFLPLPLPSSMFGNFLSLRILCPLIAVGGHVAYSGMVGCLALVVLVKGIPGLPLLVI